MTSFFFGEGTHSSPHTPLAAATAGLREVVLDEDNAEIGDDEIEVVPTITQKTAIRKQNDRDIFDMWVFENNEKLIKERNSKRAQTESEEILSLKQLMASQESTRIIGSPRDYQMELFERAKTRNTIAVLDTGSGKTLIAVLLLRHVIDQELEDRAAGRPPRISFFLVDKVALVYQQHGVLRANLDQPTDAFSGQMNTNLWTKQAWDEHFKNNKVIVCTAAVLHHCLAHAFITINQINLLIFDEAHHAKKDHPYAQIIRDFYLPTSLTEGKPRIFGMTASPVDGEAGEDDIARRASELEILLHATIATASDLTLFQGNHSARRAETELVVFPSIGRLPIRTKLHQQIWERYAGFAPLNPLFVIADEIRTRLGGWCGDRYWSFAFSEAQAKKREAKFQRSIQKRGPIGDITLLDAEIDRLRTAHEYVQQQELEQPVLEVPYLSPKVLSLLGKLHNHFERPSDYKCLVFVERKATARILSDLVQLVGGPNLRSGILTGTNSTNHDTASYTHHQQASTLMQFRKGELNCLFSTSIGEEGIDVPECNIVIRFDPCKTMIQYIQSRGRARKQNSKFVLMRERENSEEAFMLQKILDAERALKQFFTKLPADRLVDAKEGDLPDYVLNKNYGRIYVEPTTGAKLTYELALMVLQNFVDRLPYDAGEDTTVHYALNVRQGKYICEVILPSKSPIQSAVGRLASRKLIARQSAAFDACILLITGRYLDENFLPIYQKQLPTLRNARLALNSKKQSAYEMKSKPTCWEEGRGTLPGSYYFTQISLKSEWDRPVRQLVLITRMPLPQLPEFPIYRTMGQGVMVNCYSSFKAVAIEDDRMEDVTGFTLAIFKDLYNKKFEYAPEKMSYWIAPMIPEASINGPPSHGVESIDWTLVKSTSSQQPYNWTSDMGINHLVGKVLIDPFDGGRRLLVKGVAAHLKPNDAVPEGVAGGYRLTSIMEYSVAMWTRARRDAVWDETQPVIQADKITHRLNVLASPCEADQLVTTNCFVVPQPFKVSLLPADIFGVALLFPALIHRIESYLIALEFSHEVGVTVEPALALEALTKDSGNSDDQQAEQINFERGMGSNYERLEFIGDCFLKMATTIAVFVRYAAHDEFFMHCDRMTMLTNSNLCDQARHRRWYKYIRSKEFSRRTWYPHGITLLAGKGSRTQEQQAAQQQALGDKTIADICESLIGAALLTHLHNGRGSTSQLDESVKAVTRIVVNENHTFLKWNDYYAEYAQHLPKYQTTSTNASERDLAAKVELEHQYRFGYPRLLRCAFTHPSMPKGQEGIPSYQRLEFLGDSLLDMTAVRYLAIYYPTKDPGWLTEHKMAMVSNKFLGALCVKLGFHTHLRQYHASLETQVRAYTEDIKEAEAHSKGQRDYWTTIREVPKCLPDIVESYVGAMFVDSKFNYAEVQRFFDEHVQWFFEDMTIYDTFASNHPITRFYNLIVETLGCSNSRMLAKETPSEDGMGSFVAVGVIIHGKVAFHGQSTGSKYAKVKAANAAFKALDGLAPYEFRRQYDCDCVTQADGVAAGVGKSVLFDEDFGTAI